MDNIDTESVLSSIRKMLDILEKEEQTVVVQLCEIPECRRVSEGSRITVENLSEVI